MSATEKYTEVAEVLGQIAPLAANAAIGSHDTGWMDMANFHRAYIHLMAGEPTATGTLNLKVQEARDLNGDGAKDLTGKAITQLGDGDGGAYVGLELQSEELDVDDGFHCIKVITTVGAAVYYHGVVVFGTVPRYPPVDVTGFEEIV